MKRRLPPPLAPPRTITEQEQCGHATEHGERKLDAEPRREAERFCSSEVIEGDREREALAREEKRRGRDGGLRLIAVDEIRRAVCSVKSVERKWGSKHGPDSDDDLQPAYCDAARYDRRDPWCFHLDEHAPKEDAQREQHEPRRQRRQTHLGYEDTVIAACAVGDDHVRELAREQLAGEATDEEADE